MLTLSLFVRLEAKPGKEEALAAFLMQGLQLANQESTTASLVRTAARSDDVCDLRRVSR